MHWFFPQVFRVKQMFSSELTIWTYCALLLKFEMYFACKDDFKTAKLGTGGYMWNTHLFEWKTNKLVTISHKCNFISHNFNFDSRNSYYSDFISLYFTMWLYIAIVMLCNHYYLSSLQLYTAQFWLLAIATSSQLQLCFTQSEPVVISSFFM